MPTSPTRRPVDVRAERCHECEGTGLGLELSTAYEGDRSPCALCNGSGWVRLCRDCNGTGEQRHAPNFGMSVTACSPCGGSGYLPIPADDPEAWVEIERIYAEEYVGTEKWLVFDSQRNCIAEGPTADAAYYSAVCKVEGWRLREERDDNGTHSVVLDDADVMLAIAPAPLTALRAAKEEKEQNVNWSLDVPKADGIYWGWHEGEVVAFDLFDGQQFARSCESDGWVNPLYVVWGDLIAKEPPDGPDERTIRACLIREEKNTNVSREQRDLFGLSACGWHSGYKTSAPYQPHSDTSRAAAKAIEPKLNRLERQVGVLLKGTPGGLTDNQMQAALAMNGNTQRPRRIRLVELGYVKDTGGRRATGSGRPATVWGWTGKEIE